MDLLIVAGVALLHLVKYLAIVLAALWAASWLK